MWFRYYDDALNDPKVQSLPGDLFKTWVNLLCAASKNDGQLGSFYELTYLLRLRRNVVEERLNKLVELGLIDVVDDHFEPHNWRKRQYKSDTSSDRVKRHREAKRNVTHAVTVTPPDTDTESDKKKDAASRTPEADLYDRGKQVLGPSSGGLISKVVKAKGGNIALARAAIELAATKSDPREYIGAIINKRDGPEQSDTVIINGKVRHRW